jgi:uncharacterized protein (DUF1697 family)
MAKELTRYIAFLRAINVGGHTVKMDELRRLFEALDFSNVETFIASGNVIFTAPDAGDRAMETRIEQHLKAELGYAVETFVRTAAEVAAVAAYAPFPAAAPNDVDRLYIGFLHTPLPAEATRKLLAAATPTDEFHVHDRELYWLCHIRSSDSKFSGAFLEKTLGQPTTLRNATTVRKLAAKYGAG